MLQNPVQPMMLSYFSARRHPLAARRVYPALRAAPRGEAAAGQRAPAGGHCDVIITRCTGGRRLRFILQARAYDWIGSGSPGHGLGASMCRAFVPAGAFATSSFSTTTSYCRGIAGWKYNRSCAFASNGWRYVATLQHVDVGPCIYVRHDVKTMRVDAGHPQFGNHSRRVERCLFSLRSLPSRGEFDGRSSWQKLSPWPGRTTIIAFNHLHVLAGHVCPLCWNRPPTTVASASGSHRSKVDALFRGMA